MNSLAYQIVEEELTDTYPVKPWSTACRDPKKEIKWKDAVELSRVEVLLTAAKRRLARIYEERGRTDEEVLAAGEEVDKLLNLYEKIMKKFEG